MPDIIHSFPTWLPRTQTWMYNQAAFLPGEWNCRVVCSATENLDQFGLPHIYSCQPPGGWGKYLGVLAERLGFQPRQQLLGRIIDQYRVGLVHSHFGHVGWADADTVARHGALQIVTFYGQDVSRLPTVAPVWRKRYLAMFERVALVLCEGEEMAKSVRELGCPQDKLKVHRLGVDLEKIRFSPRMWTSGPVRILIAAAFQEKKGIPIALQALGELKSEINYHITVIGDATNELRSKREKLAINKMIAQYGIRDRVTFLGFQPHSRLVKEAEACHVFLSPSVTAADGDSEGGAPVTVIEMAAAGLLVVSSTHKDIPAVIQHLKTGFLAKERSIEELVEIIRCICRSPRTWAAIQTRAREHIATHFNANEQGKRLAAIYSALLDKHNKTTYKYT